MKRFVSQTRALDVLTLNAHRTGDPHSLHFDQAETQALARNVTFELILAIGPLYRLKRTPTAPVEFHAKDKMTNMKAGDILRFISIKTSPSTDASQCPDFVIAGVNLSQQNHPAFVLTKDPLNDYQGAMRGGNRNHHVRGGGARLVHATQLPVGYFDDMCVNQMQGDKIKRGFLDLVGIFSVAQFSTALSRFTDLNLIHMVGIGRVAIPDGNGGLDFDWETVQKLIQQHPRALIWWHENYGPIPPTILDDAQSRVAEAQRRSRAAAGAFSTHEGRTNNNRC